MLLGCPADDEDQGGDGPTTGGAPATGSGSGNATSTTGAEGDDDGGSTAGPGSGGSSGDGPDPTDGGDLDSSGEAPGDSTDSGGPTATPPPTEAGALVPWLQAGMYLDWAAESGVHPSAGPHFGGVRTFVDAALFGSLQAGDPEHPVGAAAVKELYGDGDQIRGWAVLVKVALGAGGDGWYWFEVYDDDVLAEGTGLAGCTGCHGSGNDFVRSPFPLQ